MEITRKQAIALMSSAVASTALAGCGSAIAAETKSQAEDVADEKVTELYAECMPSTEDIFGYIQDLAGMGVRQPGTEGGMKTQQYLMDKFNEYGLEDVRVAYTESEVWLCDDWKLEVQGEEIDCYKWYMSFFDGSYEKGGLLKRGPDGKRSKHNGTYGTFSTSDPGNAEDAEVVYAYDLEALQALPEGELAGKVVVSNNSTLYNAPDEYFYARDNGAVAFVGVLNDYFDSNRYNPEDMTYFDGAYTIPGYYVTKKVGDHIRDLIEEAQAKGEVPTAHFEMTVSAEKTDKAGSVVGILPGRLDGDGKLIMVQSHFDALTPDGASQDGSGVAEILTLARFFSQIPQEKRPRGVLFVINDTHVSNYDAHDQIISDYLGGTWDDETCTMVPDAGKTDVLVDISVEHVSKEAIIEDGELVMTGNVTPRPIYVDNSKEMVQIVTEEIANMQDPETTGVATVEEMGQNYALCTDAAQVWYYGYGLPTVSYMSVMPYIYDDCDTLDMVPQGALQPVAISMANVIWRFMGLDESSFTLPKE